MSVKLRAAPCIHIIDHASRASLLHYGLLLGRDSPITVCEAYDLRAPSGVIDLDSFLRKLSLHHKVSPQLRFVGVYSTVRAGIPPVTFFDQFAAQGLEQPEIYLEMPDIESARCFLVTSRSELTVTIAPCDVEAVAVSTVLNNPNYSQDEQEIDAADAHKLAATLARLARKGEQVLLRPSSGPAHDRRLVLLARLLTGYNGGPTEENLQLSTSFICLLGAQLAATNNAAAQVHWRVSDLSKGR